MIWKANGGFLTARYNMNGTVYDCEIEKSKEGYSLCVSHKNESEEKVLDFALSGNKTRELVNSAEKFLETK